MNKSLVMFSFFLLLAISCASSRKKPIIKENGVIADMVLMYYGGAHRQTEWNEEQCMKNVAYRDKKGDLHWMFDGFLFLEFKDGLSFLLGKPLIPPNFLSSSNWFLRPVSILWV